MKGIHIPAPKDVDLAPLQSRLGQVEQALKAIHIPAPKDVDLACRCKAAWASSSKR